MASRAPRVLIVDACVLIDFMDADPSVMGVIARSVGPIHVPSPVLAEVHALDASAAESWGLQVAEPSLDQLVAAAQRRPGISFEDHLVVVMAKAAGWTCVTNDGALRKVCVADGVDVLWGLETMGLAVEAGALPERDAHEIALRIASQNPRIGDAIVERFVERFLRGLR